jgi:hypothetical protein
MSNGWRVIIRAEWVDPTLHRPHGVSYALILQNEREHRLLGFDNSHAYDGAALNDLFDHEHRAPLVERTYPYHFVSAGRLITDFFAKCETYCAQQGVAFEFFEKENLQ